MPEGPLGGPRPLANDKDVFLSFRISRSRGKFGLQPTELEMQQTYAEIRGPQVDELDIFIDVFEDGDVLISEELKKGIELSSTQIVNIADEIEEVMGVEVRSDFIQIR